MSAEIDELQELIGSAGLVSSAPRPTPADEEWNTLSSNDPRHPQNKFHAGHRQWVVEPNGSFSATGETTRTLPPAIYGIEVDAYNGIHFIQRALITDDLVDLEDSATQFVIGGIQTFWQRKAEFVKRGIVYKRGILLWGPAGSGKTSAIAFLSRDLVTKGGIVILAQQPSLLTAALTQLRRVEPERPLIVILEDIEEMIAKWGEHELLSTLDGEHQVANVVNIATTNFPERLGARIVNRPSRFDEVIKVGMPNDATRRKYLKTVLAEEIEDAELARWIRETKNLSIAHLKELVVATRCFGRSYEETLERLRKMCQRPKGEEYDDGVKVGMV